MHLLLRPGFVESTCRIHMRSESPNGYSRFMKFYLHISMDRPSAPAHMTCRIGLYSGHAGRRLFAVWRLGGPLMARTGPARRVIETGQKWPVSNEKACVVAYC